MISEIAPAKLNLYLHVGGVRADGLHELASLFVFTDIGDEILVDIAPEGEFSLEITGPFAGALAQFNRHDNLVYRAAQLLRDETGSKSGARMKLVKNLPVAAGIGGGSADAAAALKALNTVWSLDLTIDQLCELAFRLGADVPACLYQHPLLVSGAGEKIDPGPALPPLYVCLINPGVATPTGPIFKRFDDANPSPASPEQVCGLDAGTLDAVISGLKSGRNDLQAPAIQTVPEVGAALDYLAKQPDCLLARMSGSGATCFGLFATRRAADAAGRSVSMSGWWAQSGQVL